MEAVFNYDYAALYSALLEPFRSEAFGPHVATLLLGLAVVVLIAFLCLVIPQAIRLKAALATIRGGTEKESEQQKRAAFQRDYQSIDQHLLANKVTSAAWQEFRKNLLTRKDTQQRTYILNSIPPQNFFNPRNLRVQYEFARSLPNFFVGLGLLGTFVGLIAALTFSTQTLTEAVDQEQIKQALKGLLTTAAAKFYISAAGLVSSIILSFLFRFSLKYLHGIVHQINISLEERISFLNQYAISERQVTLQQASLDELKLFNTNIAMRIGDAVRTALESSNSSLTTKLDQIAEAFGRLIAASRDGASNAVSEAVKGVLDASLRNTSDALANVANSLQDLPARLSVAATSIQTAGDAAAEQQRRLAESTQTALESLMRDTTRQVARNIEQGTEVLLQNLNTAGGTFNNSTASLGAFLERFSASGEAYMKSLSSLTAQTTALEGSLSTISSRITAASESLAKTGSAVEENLARVLNGIRDFTRAVDETNRSVNTSQEAIRSAVQSLQQTMSTHVQRFDDVDERLAGIFTSISSHLELQSAQMAENLSRMDQALAGAVNQFEQLIDNLTDANADRRVPV